MSQVSLPIVAQLAEESSKCSKPVITPPLTSTRLHFVGIQTICNALRIALLE